MEMAESAGLTFGKEEHLVSRKLMDRLFGVGSRSMSAFPLRLVWLPVERVGDEPAAQVLISVSKRHLKRAVKRNRVKRQIREAYRTNKQRLVDAMRPTPGRALALAFIWQADRLYDSKDVEERMRSLLERLTERIGAQAQRKK